jgi:uncharacterized protein with NAD-binding domain and iron-sulfur cluster
MALQGLYGVVFGREAQARLDARLYPTGPAWERARDPRREPATWPVRAIMEAATGALRVASWIDRALPPVGWAARWARRLVWRAVLPAVRRSSTAHRFWLALDFVASVAEGMIRDRLFEDGAWAAIDRYDFREWLGRNGAHDETLESAYTRAIYDAAFSYFDGRSGEGDEKMSAPVALRTLARMWMTYKGAMYYKMQAGMGDTVFAPLYLVLRDRGVRFRFFHQVRSIHLSPDGDLVDRVEVLQQAEPVDDTYDPLYDVKGLPCWPSEPLYERVRDPDRIRGVDLESYYTDFPGVGTRTLRLGADFDRVVLATPVQTLPFLCQEILDRDARWRDMAHGVKAVQTASFQIWVRKDLPDLGWTLPTPILSVYVQPLNTWCDMSQVLPREAWSGDAPVGVSYFTGAQAGPDLPPPASDRQFPARMLADAKSLTLEYLKRSLTTLWPEAVDRTDPPALDWNVLFDPADERGEKRVEAQYWRSNCQPQERCTLALPGTARFRMRADDTGYANLSIAGDWIDNGIHVACMEGAIMGGIYAARAVAGVDFPVIGENLGWEMGPRETATARPAPRPPAGP